MCLCLAVHPAGCTASVSPGVLVAVVVCYGRLHECMLAGSTGCGKTQLVKGLLSKLKQEKTSAMTVNFNYYTSSESLRVAFETYLEKKTGSNYGPKGLVNQIYFVDDINLPQSDAFGTQSAIALMRQHLDYC